MDIIARQAAISGGITEVEEIIRSSQYPYAQTVAKQHLKRCEDSLRDALRAPTDEVSTRLIAVATSELALARAAAEKKKAEDQAFVDRVYKTRTNPDSGDRFIGGGVYL